MSREVKGSCFPLGMKGLGRKKRTADGSVLAYRSKQWTQLDSGFDQKRDLGVK
jgi:hypothetical protein